MAKVTLRLHKVPPEFSKQARDVENMCQHLYRKVANGEVIQDEEIDSIGSCRFNRDEELNPGAGAVPENGIRRGTWEPK